MNGVDFLIVYSDTSYRITSHHTTPRHTIVYSSIPAYHIILGQDILEGLPLLCFRNLISLGDEAASNNVSWVTSTHTQTHSTHLNSYTLVFTAIHSRTYKHTYQHTYKIHTYLYTYNSTIPIKIYYAQHT